MPHISWHWSKIWRSPMITKVVALNLTLFGPKCIWVQRPKFLKNNVSDFHLRTIVLLLRSSCVLYFDFRAKTGLEKIGGGHWVAFWGNHLKAEVVISSREWFGDQSRGGRKRGWRDKKSHSGRHYLLPRPPPNTTTRQKSLRNRPRLYENLHVRAEL